MNGVKQLWKQRGYQLVLTGLAAVLVSRPATAQKKQHPLDPIIRMAQESQKSLAKVNDYVAQFNKMEVVGGKPYTHNMFMKFRSKPFSVYLYFTDSHKGRQVMYVQGQNNGNLLAREAGLAGLGITVSLKPTSPQAMAEGRYPITKIGMKNMLAGIIAQWQLEKQVPDMKVAYYPNAKLHRPGTKLKPMECKVLESKHPRPVKGAEFYLTRLYLDKKTNLPVRVEQYGFPPRPGAKPPLLTEYTYWNVRTNVGLKPIDFDRRNPQYRF